MKQLAKLFFVLFWLAVIASLIFYYLKVREKYLPVIEFQPFLKSALASEISFGPIFETIESKKINLQISAPQNYFLELKLLPIQQEWVRRLPGEVSIYFPKPGIYLLLIKATNKAKNSTNLYFKIFSAKASAYQDKLSFSFFSNGAGLTITNISKEEIKITGLKIKSNGKEFVIPKATKIVTPSLNPIEEDIILNPAEKAIVLAGTSPLGFNFMINRCFRYLTETIKNLPSYGTCDLFSEEDLLNLKRNEYLSDNCLNFLRNLSCSFKPNIFLDAQCLKIAYQFANYQSCFQRHQKEPKFLGPYWYIYLPTQKIFDSRYSEIEIVDQNGFLVTKKKIY